MHKYLILAEVLWWRADDVALLCSNRTWNTLVIEWKINFSIGQSIQESKVKPSVLQQKICTK